MCVWVFWISKAFTDLCINSKLIQNIGECLREVDSGVGARDLNDVKKDQDRHATMLEMYAECDEGVVIGGRPGFRGEVELAFIVLEVHFD